MSPSPDRPRDREDTAATEVTAKGKPVLNRCNLWILSRLARIAAWRRRTISLPLDYYLSTINYSPLSLHSFAPFCLKYLDFDQGSANRRASRRQTGR